MDVLFYEDTVINTQKPSIFLAGPTVRGGTYDNSWRKEAVEILKELGFDGEIYIPESKKGSYEEYEFDRPTITKWEWDRLMHADVIIFWVPRYMDSTPGLTTNVEFGRYSVIKPQHIILGYPKDAVHMEYLELLYNECTAKKSTHTLKDTLETAVKELKRRY